MNFMLRLRRGLLNIAMAEPVDLTGKKALVTGCGVGSIGYETAKTLLAWGADVTITTRHHTDNVLVQLRKSVPVAGDRLTGKNLELASEQSICEFASWYKEEKRTLDILVNNAGIHLDLLSEWKAPQVTDEGIEIHWRTNYLGTVQLTQLLLPLLQNQALNSGEVRIINVVSMLHDKGTNLSVLGEEQTYNSWRAYGSSKLALMHFSTELDRRFSNVGLLAVSLHPGAVATNIGNAGLAGHAVWLGIKRWFSPIESLFLKSPYEGAQTTLHCATASGLKGGGYYRDCRLAEPSADAQDKKVARLLWEKTVAENNLV